jgi:hypothetical protein
MDSVYGADAPAALEGAAAPAPDPAKIAAVGDAAANLAAHVEARAAQSPDLADDFRDVRNVVGGLAKRFAPPAFGEAKQLGQVTETEARLVEGLVSKLIKGRAHKELSYLGQLAEDLSLAVVAAKI